MTRSACQSLLVFLAGASVAASQSFSPRNDPVKTARQLVSSIVTAKSSSGRYMASGRDRIMVYDFVRWIEDLGERYVSATGLQLPKSRTPLVRIHFLEDAEPSQKMELGARIEEGVLTHSVSVLNYSAEDAEGLMEMVSFCLTSTVAWSMRNGQDEGQAIQVPEWLTQGIAQNLYPGLRKRNSEKLLARWKSGKMVPFQDVLADDSGVSDEVLRMTRGLFVGWMLSLGRDEALLEGACRSLARLGELDSEDVEELLAQAGVADPDYAWDVWMLRQGRTVYLPGGTSIKDLDWLKGQLLIYPADYGISVNSDLPDKITLVDLIRLKRNRDIREVLKARFVAMHLRAAGKSEDFRELVKAYCKFLGGVIDQKMDWRLRGYLEDAEKELRDFEIRTLGAQLREKSAIERDRKDYEESK